MSDWGVETNGGQESAADNWGGHTNGGGDSAGDNWGGNTNGGDNAATNGGGGACFRCGQEDHRKSECTNEPAEGEREFTGACHRCGEEGHRIKDCPQERGEGEEEREFTGTCHTCGETGHRKGDCPQKKPIFCKICSEEHKTEDCTALRMDVFPNDTEDMTADAAWEALVKADKEKDIDDFEAALYSYAKALLAAGTPLELADMESGFRTEGFNTYCIAKKFEIKPNMTIVNLKGEPDREYCVFFRYSPDAETQFEKEGWPESAEENLERLSSAGFELSRKLMFCRRCNEVGHTGKYCKVEREPLEARAVIKCTNCLEEGTHWVRDCPQKRINRRLQCRNCDGFGHLSTKCTEPRSMANVECKVCSETGHFAKDCPNKPAQACRNCDSTEHMAKDCDKPRDYSRVQCKNCGEMGHTVVRCKKSVVEDGDDAGFSGGDAGGGDWGGAGSTEITNGQEEAVSGW